MKSPSIIAFISVLFVCLAICGEGSYIVYGVYHANLDQMEKNASASQKNAKRSQDVLDIQNNRDAIEAALDKYEDAMPTVAPDPTTFQALNQVTVKAQLDKSDPNSEFWNFTFESSMEFHRFLPALASFESKYPLMRFTKFEIVDLMFQ